MKTSRTPSSVILLFLFFASALPLSAAEAAALQVRVGNTVIYRQVSSAKDLRFEKVVRQTTDYSCGAAALATILTHYFGIEASESQILTAVLRDSDEATQERIRKKGISLLDLKNYAASLGVEGNGYKLSTEELKKLDRPAIVLINAKGYNHFVVIKCIEGDMLSIADPVKGNQVLRLHEFEKIWNGVLLAFKRADGEKIETNALRSNRKLPAESVRLLPSRTDSLLAISPAEF